MAIYLWHVQIWLWILFAVGFQMLTELQRPKKNHSIKIICLFVDALKEKIKKQKKNYPIEWKERNERHTKYASFE